MNPNDLKLVERIQEATQGASRVLCTLARRGKTIERDQPRRAEHLLLAMRTHPLYKGGRLAFDMLEIEDLMLEGVVARSLSEDEIAALITAGFSEWLAELRRLGIVTHDQQPAIPQAALQTSADESSPVMATPEPEDVLPRIQFGSVNGGVNVTFQTITTGAGQHQNLAEPQLTSSDYLYDYVVLGLLDLGAQRVTSAFGWR